jgi:hypothetical protein
MHIGSIVITPYGTRGKITDIINSVCVVETEGRELTFDMQDLEEVHSVESDEDNMPIPMYSIGDKVNVGDSSIVFVVNGVVYDAKFGTYYYQLNDGENRDMDIIEEEDELSIVLDDDTEIIPFEKQEEKEEKKDTAIVGIVSYINNDKPRYVSCSLKQLMIYVKHKDVLPNIKTYVVKTGRSFPGTERFTQEDIDMIPSAKSNPTLKTGLRVLVYRCNKWGTVQEKAYPNSYYYPIKMDDGTNSSHLTDEDVFILVS